MKVWKNAALSLGLGFGLALGGGAGAESHGAGMLDDAEPAFEVGEESLPGIAEEPAAASEAELGLALGMPTGSAPPAAPVPAPAEPAGAGLGVLGYDAEGRPGRIHVVATGDTLWDISDAYLGTPWVWPSIWQDNGQLENPHRIHPGDRIWITPTEMRRISAEEAEALMAGSPAAPVEEFAPVEPMAPAAPDPLPEPAAATAVAAPEARSVRVSGREATGLISPDRLRSAASLVDKVTDRLLLSQEDQAFIGLGEGEVSPGDEFTIFRTREVVEDPDTGRVLGYHADILGWASVEETYPETSLVTVRMSTGPLEIGDRVMPREPVPPEVTVQPAPDGIEGKITFFPRKRVLMGFGDFVYLNRGSLDGLEVGSPLEVYRPGAAALEEARDEYVSVPDRVVASMLVVRTEEGSSVAVVTAAEGPLELGDRFRGAGHTP